MRRPERAAAIAAVLGPGLLAGLSDDDPPGITTYAILGADHGYQLLWALVLATAALVIFHELGARMGIVTGRARARALRGAPRRAGSLATGAAIVLIAACVAALAVLTVTR